MINFGRHIFGTLIFLIPFLASGAISKKNDHDQKFVASPVNPAQMKSIQAMMAQNDILNVHNQLMDKKNKKAELLQELKELQPSEKIANQFRLNSKLALIRKNKMQANNDLQQLEIDIKQLEAREDLLKQSLKTLSTNSN